METMATLESSVGCALLLEVAPVRQACLQEARMSMLSKVAPVRQACLQEARMSMPSKRRSQSSIARHYRSSKIAWEWMGAGKSPASQRAA